MSLSGCENLFCMCTKGPEQENNDIGYAHTIHIPHPFLLPKNRPTLLADWGEADRSDWGVAGRSSPDGESFFWSERPSTNKKYESSLTSLQIS